MKKATLILGVISFLVLFTGMLHADFIMLGPSDFSPQDPDEGNWFMHYSGASIHPQSGALYRNLIADLHLPNGSIIDRVKIYYIDNGPGYIKLSMYRHRPVNLSFTFLGQWQSSGSVNHVRTDAFGSLNKNKINWHYKYSIGIYFSADTSSYQLLAVKIEYHPPTP